MSDLGMVERKIYTTRQMWVSSFIFGPIAGIYLLSKNFETFKDNENAKRTLIIGLGIVTILIIIALLIEIPKTGMIIPIIYTVLIKQYANACQKEKIKQHLDSGGKKYSNWRVLGISILSLLALLALALVIVMILPVN